VLLVKCCWLLRSQNIFHLSCLLLLLLVLLVVYQSPFACPRIWRAWTGQA